MANHKVLLLDVEAISPLTIYSVIREGLQGIIRVQIIYKYDEREYVSENISLGWLHAINSHDFFVWLEYKRAQKQKYNIQNYAILLRVELKSHTNR